MKERVEMASTAIVVKESQELVRATQIVTRELDGAKAISISVPQTIGTFAGLELNDDGISSMITCMIEYHAHPNKLKKLLLEFTPEEIEGLYMSRELANESINFRGGHELSLTLLAKLSRAFPVDIDFMVPEHVAQTLEEISLQYCSHQKYGPKFCVILEWAVEVSQTLNHVMYIDSVISGITHGMRVMNQEE